MRYNGRPARRAGGRPAPPPAVEADLCLLVCGKAVISPRDVLSFVPWRSRRLSFLDQQSAVIDSWVEYLFAGTNAIGRQRSLTARRVVTSGEPMPGQE